MNAKLYGFRCLSWWRHFLAHVVMALDDFLQAFTEQGVIGVSISSRSGTAKYHGHLWGKIVCATVLAWWPFGLDKDTGETHEEGAIESDIMRALIVPHVLIGDPVVYAGIRGDEEPAFKVILAMLANPAVVAFMDKNRGIR